MSCTIEDVFHSSVPSTTHPHPGAPLPNPFLWTRKGGWVSGCDCIELWGTIELCAYTVIRYNYFLLPNYFTWLDCSIWHLFAQNISHNNSNIKPETQTQTSHLSCECHCLGQLSNLDYSRSFIDIKSIVLSFLSHILVMVQRHLLCRNITELSII